MKKYWYLIATGIFLLGALGSWPYAYYQLLRWVVCGVAAYTAYLGFEMGNKGWGWLMIAIAVLFNPMAPIYLAKGTWAVLDVITAILFFSAANFLKDLDFLKNYHAKLHQES